jgi:hypothetical protein
VNQAIGAKTRGELPPLLADLPPLARPPAVAPARRPGRTLLMVALLVLIAASLASALAVPVAHVQFGWLPLAVLILIAVRLGRRRRYYR